MKPYISADMQNFLKPKSNEEAVDQPLYHGQTVSTTSSTQYTFFNTPLGGYSVTNMDAASVLSKGKRFGVFSIGVAFIPGQLPLTVDAGKTAALVTSGLNDAKTVLEAAGWLEFSVLDKKYLVETPLTRCPAGIGVFGGGSTALNLASAADYQSNVGLGTNGLPVFGNVRKLRVPIPLPEQVRFGVTVNFNSVSSITVTGP